MKITMAGVVELIGIHSSLQNHQTTVFIHTTIRAHWGFQLVSYYKWKYILDKLMII